MGGVYLTLMLAWTPASGQTLKDALARAYHNNPELLAQRANLRATDEGVPQALSNWRPDVEVTGDIARTHTHLTSRKSDRTQTRTPRGIGLDVSQSLFRGFRTEAATSKAENAVLEGRQTLIAMEQDILLEAVVAYAAVFRDQAVLELSVNNEQVLARQLQATRDRFRVGEITRTDVSQAEARLAGTRADRVKAEGDLEKSRANYR
ncbi:MAG: TolC family protein, partial [Rhodospirillales bacterium]|nr:TolC family protein [Rhodospirillales bacterium]